MQKIIDFIKSLFSKGGDNIMAKINLNQFAKEVTEEEGGATNLSIAQVKEVLRIVFTKLAKMDIYDLADTLKRYKNK